MDDSSRTETAAGDTPRLALSDGEGKLLELYDRAGQLLVEENFLRAQMDHGSAADNPAERSDDAVKAAQDDLLDRRASYQLRRDVVDAVRMAGPVLQAVHGGSNATVIERDLLPLVERRDQVSTTVAKQATELSAALTELTRVQGETMRASRANVQLTSEMLALARKLEEQEAVPLDSDELRLEMSAAEDQVKASRQKWKVMKGAASAVVAGSGVDWAKDPELRDIVLDHDSI